MILLAVPHHCPGLNPGRACEKVASDLGSCFHRVLRFPPTLTTGKFMNSPDMAEKVSMIKNSKFNHFVFWCINNLMLFNQKCHKPRLALWGEKTLTYSHGLILVIEFLVE